MTAKDFTKLQAAFAQALVEVTRTGNGYSNSALINEFQKFRPTVKLMAKRKYMEEFIRTKIIIMENVNKKRKVLMSLCNSMFQTCCVGSRS